MLVLEKINSLYKNFLLMFKNILLVNKIIVIYNKIIKSMFKIINIDNKNIIKDYFLLLFCRSKVAHNVSWLGVSWGFG